MEASDQIINFKVYDKTGNLVYDLDSFPHIFASYFTLFYSPLNEFSVKVTWPNGKTLTTPVSNKNSYADLENLNAKLK